MRTFDAHSNLRWTSHEAPTRNREEWKIPKEQALAEVSKSLYMRPMALVNFIDRCENDTRGGRSQCRSCSLLQRPPMMS